MASSKDAHRNGAHGPKVIVSSRGGDSWFKFLYFIIRKFKGRTDRFCSSRQTVTTQITPTEILDRIFIKSSGDAKEGEGRGKATA